MPWIWMVVLVPLGAFVAWGFVEAIVVAPRRAAAGLQALAAALGKPIVRVDEFRSHIEATAGGRDLQLRSEFVGSGGSVRGERGRLLVTAMPLRSPAWAMHDLQLRQRRSRASFERRFAIRESGVPVREHWLDETVRAAFGRFYDHPLAVGTLRVERGELQHVAYWSDVDGAADQGRVQGFLDTFADVAASLERAAGRRHPMM